jgi:uncharacterized protein YjbI with pentapeptide repeats
MLRPAWGETGTRADVGVALITATVISLAVFVLQILDENRLEREDTQRQDQAANQALRLQLGLSKSLQNMDLHGQDLRGIILSEKHLESANFQDADLSGANLQGDVLTYASLGGADLEGANLSHAQLDYADLTDAHLGGKTLIVGADLRNANLLRAQFQGATLDAANLRGAIASGANFSGAVTNSAKGDGLQYDGQTVFPNGKTRSCSNPPCILTAEQWRAVQS